MVVDNSSYSITYANGNPLVDVSNGKLNPETVDSGFEQRVTAIGPKAVNVPKAVFTPTEKNRVIKSNSGGLSFKAMDGTSLMEVKTQAPKAEFGLGNETGANKEGSISIPLKEGETFSVKMAGINGGNAEVSGTGTNAGENAEIKLNGNNLELQNVKVESIELNGKSSKNKDGNSIDVNGLKAWLDRYVVAYDGKQQKPAVHVTDGGKTLVENTDYVLSYVNNTESGNACVYIKGIAAYTGERQIRFRIADKARDDLYMVHFYLNGHGKVAPEDALVVKGSAVTRPANPLAAGFEFEGWYKDKECKQKYEFADPVNDNMTLYAGWTKLGDEVLAVSFSNDPDDGQIVKCDANGGEPYCIYTGSKITPSMYVTFGDRILKKDVDYKVTYSNNKNVTGSKKASATVTLKGNFKGSETLKFAITKKDISDGNGKPADDIEIDPVIAEKGKKAVVTITYGDYVLTSKDFTTDPKSPVAGKDTTVSITGKGSFTGEIKDIPIKEMTKAEMKEYKISAVLKKGTAKVYDGTAKTLTDTELVVKDGKGNVLKNGSAYSVTYSKNINAGTAKAVIKGKGSYYGKVTKKFKIKPDTKVELKDVELADDGEIYCFTGPAKPELIVTKTDGTELTEGKDYAIKYGNNSKPGENAKYTVNFKGNYKGRKAVKGTFEIIPAPMSKAVIEACDSVYLKPEKLKPRVFVRLDGVLIDPKNYTVNVFYGDENITRKKFALAQTDSSAEITVKVTGKKVFDDETATGKYTINALPEDAYNLTDAKIYTQSSNELLNKVPYTGKAVEPAVDVKVKKGSELVTVPADAYSVGYLNNTERGKATIIIIGDNKKAFGSRTGTFTIGTRSVGEFWKLIFSK